MKHFYFINFFSETILSENQRETKTDKTLMIMMTS